MNDACNGKMTYQTNTDREIQIRKYASGSNNRKIQFVNYFLESGNREVHIWKIQFGKIQVGKSNAKYKSEDTHRKIQIDQHVNRKIEK